MKSIHIAGVNYAVAEWGTGQPLLLLHGFTGSYQVFEPFIDSWPGFRCIAPDMMGHGATDTPADYRRYDMAKTIADLAGILDYFDIEEADVLGYSMGGRIALAFAARYRDRVGKLILEGASPGLRTVEERADRTRRDEALADRIEADGVESFVNNWERIPLFASQQRISTDSWNRQRNIRLSHSARGLAHSLRGVGTGAQPSFWGKLSEIGVQTLLITGELDTKFTTLAKEMVRQIPRASHAVVSDAGHTPHIEQPGVFADLVKQFLTAQI